MRLKTSAATHFLGLILLLALFGSAACAPTPVLSFASPTLPPQPSALPSQTDSAQPSALPGPTDSARPAPDILPADTPNSLFLQPVQKPAATLRPSPTPPLLAFSLPKGPSLIYTGQTNAMRVFWQWNASAQFRIDWGTDAAYALGSAQVVEYDAQRHLYAYTISGLQPATLYRYRVVLGQNASTATFRTAPAAAETRLKFVSYGDTRTHPDVHDAVASQILALYGSDPLYQTFNLLPGDLVAYGDDDATWDDELFSPVYANIHALMANLAWLPVMGNHEGSGVLFARYFPLPFVASRYASFDYGPAHITLIDQYIAYTPGSAQYEWIKADLSGSTRTWKIVVLHEPGWSAWGAHANNAQVQNDLQPLFEQNGVKLVIAGHNHYYARAEANGVTHLTIGTGGAPLYPPANGMPNVLATYEGNGFVRFQIDGADLGGEFVGADGLVKDSFHIQR